MQALADLLINFIDWNSKLDFDLLISLIIGYVVLFWLIVSYTLYKDAKLRYHTEWAPYLVAVLNFFLFIPFLILYLLVRPQIQDEYEDWHDGGINIPIVNFVGKEGVEMSFELRINPRRVAKQNEGEMKIDISFDSTDQNKVMQNLTPRPQIAVNNSVVTPNVLNKLGGYFGKAKQRLDRSIGELKSNAGVEKEDEKLTKVADNTQPQNPVEQKKSQLNELQSFQPQNKKKKKKKKKR